MPLTRRHAIGLGAATVTGLGLGATFGMRGLAQEDTMAEPDTMMAGDTEILIHPVSHASLVLETPAGVIYADPVGEPAAYDGLPPADLILVTHEHGDHYNAETLGALINENAGLVTNPAVHGMLPADLQSRATAIGNGESQEAMGIAIDAIPAYNMTEDRLQYHPEGRDNGYILGIGEARVYIAGDTEDIPEMRALTGIDLAFVPMNLPFTMSVDQAASGVLAFAPRIVYPYHYRGSDVEQFKQMVEAENAEIEVRLAGWYDDE